MKSLNDWFLEYGESHQNSTNQIIHYICVPVIFFSICGLIMSIPFRVMAWYHPSEHPIVLNWAFHILILVLIYYFFLSFRMGASMTFFATVCLVGNYFLSQIGELWLISLILFALGWIGQFYGHKVEGKKPSFLKDIQFLLIGPAWVMHKIFFKRSDS